MKPQRILDTNNPLSFARFETLALASFESSVTFNLVTKSSESPCHCKLDDVDSVPSESLTNTILSFAKSVTLTVDSFVSFVTFKLASITSSESPCHCSLSDVAKRPSESEIYTIIEVDTRDRLGVLYDLTRTLAAANVNISSAVIATYGEQVVDTFYVKDMFGLKLHAKAKRDSLEQKLRDALKQGATRALS